MRFAVDGAKRAAIRLRMAVVCAKSRADHGTDSSSAPGLRRSAMTRNAVRIVGRDPAARLAR
jgi:hypothetical protein